MDVRQLAHVVAVVDEGGFTRAARAQHVSQPALSQSVRALERELGVELFHRVGRSVRLTAAGEALLGPARQALRDVRNARAAVEDVKGLDAGRLDLVCLATLAVRPVADLVGRFRRLHPGVEVAIGDPQDPDDLLAAVRDGRAELAVTELTGDLRGLEATPTEVQDLVAVVPEALLPADLAGPGAPATLVVGRLADLPLVTSPPDTSVRRLLEDALSPTERRPTVVVETAHREAIGPLVLAGAVAAVMPVGAAADMVRGVAGVRVMALDPPVRRRTGVVHRAGPLSPAARAFLALVDPARAR